MRLGINGFFWNQETTGSGQYTHHLGEGLRKLPDGPECLFFRPGGGRSTPHGTDQTHHRYLTPAIPLTRNLAKVWFEQVSFPDACAAERVDVAHVPYFAPPLRAGAKTVVTIHDLIPLILPPYRGSILVRLYTRLAALGARRAAAIVTDSQSSCDDILRLLDVSPDRVHVVYLAAHRMFKPVTDAERLLVTREKYDLPEKYVLYLGGFDQRKNLRTLLAAYGSLERGQTRRAPLVIAGRLPVTDSDFFPHPRRMVEEWGLQDGVRFVGWVPEEDKPALYSGASLFVYASLYEGFGLPVLEAMSCGTPVIASRSSSLPEIVADAAILFDAQSVDELSAALATLLEDAPRREGLAARGLERALLFSWEKTVAQTMEVYQSVAGSARPSETT
jgi:glycosyltransferase involved in cell wall biosynthesis